MWIYVKRYSFNRPYFISYDRYYEIKEVLKTNESKMLVPNISLRKIFPSTFYFILIYSFLFISSPFIVRFIGSRTVPLFSESVDNIIMATFMGILMITIFGGLWDLISGNYKITWNRLLSHRKIKKEATEFYLKTFELIMNTEDYIGFLNSSYIMKLDPEHKNPNMKCDFNRLFEDKFKSLGFKLSELKTPDIFKGC